MYSYDRIITFETYFDLMLAHIICTRLKSNGIDCFIADDYMITLRPYLNQACGGFKLKVFASDFERCSEILATEIIAGDQDDIPIETPASISCAYCASTNVRRGTVLAFRFHWPSLFISLFFLMPMYFRQAWHCFNCHRDFE